MDRFPVTSADRCLLSGGGRDRGPERAVLSEGEKSHRRMHQHLQTKPDVLIQKLRVAES